VSSARPCLATSACGRLTPEHPAFRAVYGAVMSQIVTGERLGLEHYLRMAGLARTPDERLELLDDAGSEARHLGWVLDAAEAFALELRWGSQDAYWGRVRAFFEARATLSDLLGCRIVQDVVLESFAVALYASLVPRLEKPVATALTRMLADERRHLTHGSQALRSSVAQDPQGAREAVESANEAVARLLADWLRTRDCVTACGVCQALGRPCLKRDLPLLGVDVVAARARFLSTYGGALRGAGFAPASVTRWLARLAG
jgi:fatty aldehyde decarbonylase